MKHTLILSLIFLFSSFTLVAQEAQQISGVSSYKGEVGEYLKDKGDVVYPQKGYFLLQINKDVLVVPLKHQEDSKEIVSEFLSSGHSTGLKSDIITVFGWNIEQGSALKLGEGKGVVAEGGGSDI